jgi:hypothetical protein
MKNMDSLDPVRDRLTAQLTSAPVELEASRCEGGKDVMFLLDLQDGSVASAVWANAPATDLELVASLVLQYLDLHWRLSIAHIGGIPSGARHGLRN